MTHGISEESVLKRLVQQMNIQLPSRRVWLSSLLLDKDPHYTGRDGNRYDFGQPELRLVREALNRRGLRDVRLPIVIMGESSQTESVWRIEGEAECAVVSDILGRPADAPRDRLFLYIPHLAMVRRKLPTATVCMFMP